MIRTQIQLTEQQDRALEALAAARDVSKAELVRRAVDLLLQHGGDAAAAEAERRTRALSVIGCARGDGSNVSEEHDAYLTAAAWEELEANRPTGVPRGPDGRSRGG